MQATYYTRCGTEKANFECSGTVWGRPIYTLEREHDLQSRSVFIRYKSRTLIPAGFGLSQLRGIQQEMPTIDDWAARYQELCEGEPALCEF